MNERELFEEWCVGDDEFCTHRYDGADDYSDDYTQSAWLAWQASANRQGYKLVPVEAIGDVLIINYLSIHINQTGGGRVFCDITIDGDLISQKNSIEDAVNFCKEYKHDAN